MEASSKKRFYMLDTIRGIMITGVVLFHFAFDLYYEGLPIADKIIFSPAFEITANIGRFLFLFIAGICSSLSRNNFKRSLFVLGGAFAVSLATFILDMLMYKEVGSFFIYFGILHLMGVCMLLYAFFELVTQKIKMQKSDLISWVMFAFFIIISLYTFDLPSKKVGFFSFSHEISSPLCGTFVGKILGFPGFYLPSADWFGFFPWGMMFFAGASLGKYFKEDRVPAFLHKDICPPLSFIGRKTLWIYLLHQPLVYGIAFLIVNSVA